MKTLNDIEQFISVLTNDEKQLLKDTITMGIWGDCEQEFLDNEKRIVTDWCMGYCTNDAHKAGHYKGRILSTMFRSLYKKLCPANRNQIGAVISHCNDWWGDGSGDMLFIRTGYYDLFEKWARM